MGDLDKFNIPPHRRWKPGDPAHEAAHLDEPAATLNKMGSVGSARQVNPPGGGTFGVRLFRVVEFKKDHIIVKPFGGLVDFGTEPVDLLMPMALPHLLQETHYSTRIAYGVALEKRKFMRYVYGVAEPYRRTAFKEDQETGEETDSIQTIIPSYEVDDVVIGMTGIGGGTNVEIEGEDGMVPLAWIDTNNDGRFWGKDKNTDDVL